MSDEKANTFAYEGAEKPGTSANEFNVNDFAIDRRLAEVSTATLVKIIKDPYDADGNPITPGSPVPIGFVDVQPMVKQLDGYGNATPHGNVYRLNYFRYEGGYGAIINDPKKDDIGKMVVSDRDTSGVRRTHDLANPGSLRRFDKADGTFFGKSQSKTAPQQWVAFTTSGINIQDKNGNTIVTDNTGITINGVLFAKTTHDVTMPAKLTVQGDTSVQNINIAGTETGGGPG